MTNQEAIDKLEEMQTQIVHGSTVFEEVAENIRMLERELKEARETIGFVKAERDALRGDIGDSNAKRDKALAAAAEMRVALLAIKEDVFKGQVTGRSQTLGESALSSEAGRGWLSPEQVEASHADTLKVLTFYGWNPEAMSLQEFMHQQTLARHEMAQSLTKLRAFAQDILRESRGDLGPGDVGGDFVQESGLKHGLLATKTVTEPCCENCPCADVGDFPTQCHFETELVDPHKK